MYARAVRSNLYVHIYIYKFFSFFLSRLVLSAPSIFRPSSQVCGFALLSAVVRELYFNSPPPRPPPPLASPRSKKARKFTGRWHEKMGRKGLNCDAAGAALREQADWKHISLFSPSLLANLPTLAISIYLPTYRPTSSTYLLRFRNHPASLSPALTLCPFFAFSFFPRRQN